ALEALGQSVDRLVGHRAQLHFGHHLVDAPLLFLTTETTNVRNELEKLQDCHVGVAGSAFGKVANQGFDGNRVDADVVPVHLHRSGGGRQESGNDLHGGGLARTVGPEKAKNLALGHAEAQVIDCGKIVELLD